MVKAGWVEEARLAVGMVRRGRVVMRLLVGVVALAGQGREVGRLLGGEECSWSSCSSELP